MKKLVLFSILFFFSFSFLPAQELIKEFNYPKGMMKNPLKIPISLAGNYGECRPNHFHSGIDVRTNKEENQPVLTIADGYISKISIKNKGFGNCIYINHKGGYTSVYAHLNSFSPQLEKYTKALQYKNKSWEIEIELPPYQFPISEGTQFALSGNTGSSQAPHLHLEIRDTKTDKTLNGLLFFDTLTDTQKPEIYKLAIYKGNQSIYEQNPEIITVNKKMDGEFALANSQLNIADNKVFFGIKAGDLMEEALGTLGIYAMQINVDGKPFFEWQVNNISYAETHYMNALADYKTKMLSGPWIQLCRKLPNDNLEIYNDIAKKNGVIDLSDGKLHRISIQVFDVRKNKSELNFNVQGSTTSSNISICKSMMKAGEKNEFKSEQLEVLIPSNALYDNICFTSNISLVENKTLFQIHQSYVPIHDTFLLKLKPNFVIPKGKENKIVLVHYDYNDLKNPTSQAAKFDGKWVFADVKHFGFYEISLDETPPNIGLSLQKEATLKNGQRISFNIEDVGTAVKNVTAWAGKNWINLSQQKKTYTLEVDNYFPKGKQTLKIIAEDFNGNKCVKEFIINK